MRKTKRRYSARRRVIVRYVYPKRRSKPRVKHTKGFLMSMKPYPKV